MDIVKLIRHFMKVESDTTSDIKEGFMMEVNIGEVFDTKIQDTESLDKPSIVIYFDHFCEGQFMICCKLLSTFDGHFRYLVVLGVLCAFVHCLSLLGPQCSNILSCM